MKLLGFYAAVIAASLIVGVGMGRCVAHAGQYKVEGTVRIAVLDSGFGNTSDLPLCPGFTYTAGLDDERHGINVLGLIHEKAKRVNVCYMLFKVFKDKNFSPKTYEKALLALIKNPPHIVNLSISGNSKILLESELLHTLASRGTHILAAAGNEGKNLSVKCDVYPACLPFVIAIGAIDLPQSNYGLKVKVRTLGKNQCARGVCSSGTSQATANATGILALMLGGAL